MATKYVLNSGGVSNHPAKKRGFHREIVKDLGQTPLVLICIFAQAREYWEEKYPSYSQSVIEDMPEDIKPTFKLAMPDTFAMDCQEADVIHMTGGDDHLLQYWLKQFDIPNIWKDKVVSTNSASSDALAAHFWPCDWRQPMDGLGDLPIKFIPHYDSDWGNNDPRRPIDWKAAYDDLAKFGGTSLPIHALKEGDYIVIEQ